MNNPKKLEKLGTQEENKQNKAQIHNIRYVYLVIQNVCVLFTRPSYDIPLIYIYPTAPEY
jgi:hypothetical protein